MTNEERIAKLPVWAKEYIRDLERRKDNLVEQVKFLLDDQKKPGTGADYIEIEEGFGIEGVRRFFPSHTLVRFLCAGDQFTVGIYDGTVTIQTIYGRISVEPVASNSFRVRADGR
jgi:hypothetical protein